MSFQMKFIQIIYYNLKIFFPKKNPRNNKLLIYTYLIIWLTYNQERKKYKNNSDQQSFFTCSFSVEWTRVNRYPFLFYISVVVYLFFQGIKLNGKRFLHFFKKRKKKHWVLTKKIHSPTRSLCIFAFKSKIRKFSHEILTTKAISCQTKFLKVVFYF